MVTVRQLDTQPVADQLNFSLSLFMELWRKSASVIWQRKKNDNNNSKSYFIWKLEASTQVGEESEKVNAGASSRLQGKDVDREVGNKDSDFCLFVGFFCCFP